MSLSLYKRHVAKWENCDKCLLCKHRTKTVIARGKVPAEILFIGEAPGTSEDILGLPSIGPAGKLLDHIIDKAVDSQYDYAFTNLICCLPKNNIKDKEELPKEAILACKDRLVEFIELCQPSLIVYLGKLSHKYVPKLPKINYAAIINPAAILRMDVSQQRLAIKRCIVTIEDAISLYL
jgi:uracil-DNA glycosylase